MRRKSLNRRTILKTQHQYITVLYLIDRDRAYRGDRGYHADKKLLFGIFLIFSHSVHYDFMLPNKPHFFRLETLETIFGITILCRTHLFLKKNAMCMHWIFMQKQTFTRIKTHMEQWIMSQNQSVDN